MKQKQKRTSDIYFISILKVTITFILIMCILTITILISSFTKTSFNNTLSKIEYIYRNLEFYFTSADNFSKTLSSDSIIQDNISFYNDAPNNFEYIKQKEMRQRIESTIQSSSYIHSVNIYSRNGNLLASNSNYASKTMKYSSDTVSSPLWTFQTMKNNVTRKNEQVLSLLKPIYNVSTAEKIGYIEVVISNKAITELISDHYDTSNHMFLIDSNYLIQFSNISDEVLTTIEYEPYIKNSEGNFFTNDGVIFKKNILTDDYALINVINYTTYFKPLFIMLLITIFTTLFCIFIVFKISKKISHTITKPVYTLIEQTKKITKGNWETLSENNIDNYDIDLLYQKFNQMILAQNTLKDKLIQEQKDKNKLSLQILQEQINPHFLYNTLDNICALAELDEKENLINLVMNLSTFYRMSLNKGKFIVTLKEELTLTKAYLHIMEIRYFHKFKYTINCPEKLYNYTCLKLMLQPLIENSIYHGIKNITTPGEINITIYDEDEHLIITIADNGKGFTDEDVSKFKGNDHHFGVWSTNERIRLYFGNDSGLFLQHNQPCGCIATIKLPLRKENNDEL